MVLTKGSVFGIIVLLRYGVVPNQNYKDISQQGDREMKTTL